MKNILLIQSSPKGPESCSNKVARALVNDLKARNPDAEVVTRDLGENPPPHIGSAYLAGLGAKPGQHTAEQAIALSVSDNLIDEVAAADLLVLAVPMHNFGPPSTLKAWLDHVIRGGRTFAYTQNGPQGLLKGKRAILVLSRGGVYSDGPAKAFDFQEPYLCTVLGFIGITDVEVVRVEGVAASAIGPEKAVSSALQQSKELLLASR